VNARKAQNITARGKHIESRAPFIFGFQESLRDSTSYKVSTKTRAPMEMAALFSISACKIADVVEVSAPPVMVAVSVSITDMLTPFPVSP
jgi:hypothetical protein